jgi:hypothetical protein
MRSANVQVWSGTRSSTYASPTLEIYYMAAGLMGRWHMGCLPLFMHYAAA